MAVGAPDPPWKGMGAKVTVLATLSHNLLHVSRMCAHTCCDKVGRQSNCASLSRELDAHLVVVAPHVSHMCATTCGDKVGGQSNSAKPLCRKHLCGNKVVRHSNSASLSTQLDVHLVAKPPHVSCMCANTCCDKVGGQSNSASLSVCNYVR